MSQLGSVRGFNRSITKDERRKVGGGLKVTSEISQVKKGKGLKTRRFQIIIYSRSRRRGLTLTLKEPRRKKRSYKSDWLNKKKKNSSLSQGRGEHPVQKLRMLCVFNGLLGMF